MKIALGLAYDGTHFNGYQTQPQGNTIQDHLERAI
ncbi:MAG: tRNA pseudouridine(38-40) synthase TruA, partial [Betaproteobacteria bacterium]|nr:tRNA pseudouridine(38-40) synthase TruA [Betaproteobacteria bacterium]